MTTPHPSRQRGAATLLFIVLACLGLLAATTSSLFAGRNAQSLQYAVHTSAQAQMRAWTGVNAISKTLATLTATPTMTAGASVGFTNLPSGLSARYVGAQNGFLVFDITGASAGATSTLRVAYLPPTGGGGSGGGSSFGQGVVLHGDTTISGSTSYIGSGTANIHVHDGNLTLSASLSGLNEVCADGDITLSGALGVRSLCTNGSISMSGSAVVGTASVPAVLNAVGSVSMSGGSGVHGAINSNSTVNLSGSNIPNTAINATGDVTVPGSASVGSVKTQGNIVWNATSNSATSLTANGAVTYRPSGNTASTAITAGGNVTLTDARSVTTTGNTALVGGAGQGIRGPLAGQGSLSWSNTSGIVNSGTIGGALQTGPRPFINVTASPGYKVTIPPFTMPPVTTFTPVSLTVDTNALRPSANFAFTGADAKGNPIVAVKNVNGVADGTYFVSQKSGASSEKNWLCAAVSNTACTSAPLARICSVGGSPGSSCFSFSSGTWTISGTMLPSVAWFAGTLKVGTGPWINTFLATGDITLSANQVYSPNFVGSASACNGAAYTPPASSGGASVPAMSALGLSASNYATQLCTGSPAVLSGEFLGNHALVAGSYSGGTFSGGSITISGSAVALGSILAGHLITNSGSTVIAGSIFSGKQGGGSGKNVQSGNTTIITVGASSSFKEYLSGCITACAGAAPANNVVWVSPI